MATDTEQLVVDLVARVSQFERDIKRAEGTGTRSFSTLRRSAATASRSMEVDFTRSAARIDQVMASTQGAALALGKRLASSLAVPLTGAGILATLNKVKSELVAIGELSRYSGLSVGQTAALRNVATASGGSAEQMAATIKKVADNIAEASREETEFGKLLEANGVKIKDRQGRLINTNEALQQAARLIQNAANESDRIKIAEQLGIARELIPLFAKGAEHLAQQRALHDRNNAGLAEAVKKAEEFDKHWNEAWGRFQLDSKTALLDVGTGLASLAERAINFVKGLNELRNYSVTATRGGIRGPFIPGVTDSEGYLLGQGQQIYNEPVGPNRPAETATRTIAPRGPFTIIPPSGGGGGRGGSGAGETDTAKNRLDKYIDSLARQDAVMQAQIATFGQSNAVQKAAEEIARAQVDLNRLDASTRAEVTRRLTDQVAASETLRAKLEEMQRAQRYAIEANEALRDGVKGIFTDMSSALQNGGNLFEAFGKSALNQLNRISDKLMQMAIDQLWLKAFGGNGGLFGTGGLLSSVFGAAGGGGGITGTQLFADGGLVRGPGTGTSDSIVARLSNREYVVNAQATARHLPLLDAINRGTLPAFASGGLVQADMQEFASVAVGKGRGYEVSFA